MAAETLLLPLATTVPAALGTWSAAAFFLWALRVRDATLRAAVWTWAAVTAAAVVVGLPSTGLLGVRVVIPLDHPLVRDGVTAPATLAIWIVVAGFLVARRRVRDARLVACVEGVASTSAPPVDLVDAVERAARWLGVAAPRVASAETDGTAFVVGVRAPVLFVPLALWRRLDAAERRALVLHELAHVRRRDPLRLLALTFLVDALWPAFALRWTAARLRDAWESQADEEAVRDGATRSALARSLVAAGAGAPPAGVLAFGGAARSTVGRLAALTQRARAGRLIAQTAALAFLVPWCPSWTDGGVSLRPATGSANERTGVVSVRLGAGGDPFTQAVFAHTVGAARSDGRRR